MDDGSERTVDTGPKCDYSGGAFVSVLYSDARPGLTHLYGLNEEDVWSCRAPTEVDGYPAVAYMLAGRGTHRELQYLGRAGRHAVLRDDRVGPGGAEFCVRAKSLAEMVLATIKAGQ